MSKLALLPLVIATISAMLTWAMAKHLQISQAQRETAALRPRSRPYPTTLPKSLIQR